MTLRRLAPFFSILLLGFAAQSQAQMMAPQGPPCMANFLPLRAEAEKRAGLIKAAGQRHAPPHELCQLFKSFSEAEEKVVKFVETNASSCGIPREVLTATKASHTKTGEMRQRVCTAVSERRGPGLGEALGMRAVPTPETTSTGKGTLDTLNGNALAK